MIVSILTGILWLLAIAGVGLGIAVLIVSGVQLVRKAWEWAFVDPPVPDAYTARTWRRLEFQSRRPGNPHDPPARKLPGDLRAW
jgi:hypothetical protein